MGIKSNKHNIALLIFTLRFGSRSQISVGRQKFNKKTFRLQNLLRWLEATVAKLVAEVIFNGQSIFVKVLPSRGCE